MLLGANCAALAVAVILTAPLLLSVVLLGIGSSSLTTSATITTLDCLMGPVEAKLYKGLRPPLRKPSDSITSFAPGSSVWASMPAGSTDADLLARLQSAADSAWPSSGPVVVEPSTYDRVPPTGAPEYLSADDPTRAKATFSALGRSGLAMAARGGYGTARVLDLLDWDLLSGRSPGEVAIVMGYSDLTALLVAVYVKTGRVTLHGPMGLGTWAPGGANERYARAFLLEPRGDVVLRNDPGFGQHVTVRGGRAKGRLIGGNLSVFVSLVGSAYLPSSLEGYILFLEDVEEAPYRIDRMLETLRLEGMFDKISGFVWGTCTDCNRATDTWTVEDVIDSAFANATYPVFRNAQFGHIDDQYTVPIGPMATIDADSGVIAIASADLD